MADKVGVGVEIDSRKATKNLDDLNAGLLRITKAANTFAKSGVDASKPWETWVNQLKSGTKTVDDTRKAIASVSGAIQSWRTILGAGSKETAQYTEGLRTLLWALREHEKQLRQVEQAEAAATQERKRAEAETRKQAKASEQLAKAREREEKATARSAKKMALWAVGAASAYRMFMKLRRAISEQFEALYGDTEEWKRFNVTLEQSKAVMVAAIISADDMADTLTFLNDRLTTWNQIVILASATTAGLGAIMEHVATQTTGADGLGPSLDKAASSLGSFLDAAAAGDWAAVYDTLVGKDEDIGAVFWDAYIASFSELGNVMDDVAKKIADQEDSTDKMLKAWEKYQEQILKLEMALAEDLLKTWEDYYADLADLKLDYDRDLQELYIDAARDREDIEIDYQRRLEKAELDRQRRYEKYQKDLEKLRWNHFRKLEDIEHRYHERVRDIERRFGDDMYDAISERDATKALRATRQRSRDLEDAQRDRDYARRREHEDYLQRLKELEESLRAQEEDLELWRQRQLEDLARNLKQQEEDLLRSYHRRKQELEDHLNWTLERVRRENWLEQQMAYGNYLALENMYRGHLFRMQAIRDAYSGAWKNMGIPQHLPQGFAHGGSMIVNKPTMAMFGEGPTPELIMAMPLPSVAHNVTGSVSHQVDAQVSRSVSGYEGRISGAVSQALMDVFGG